MTKKNGAATKRKNGSGPGIGETVLSRGWESRRGRVAVTKHCRRFFVDRQKDTPLTACLKGFCSKKEPVMSCLTENPAFLVTEKVLPDIFYPDGYGPSGL